MKQSMSVPRLRQETVQKILKAADYAKLRVSEGAPVDVALAEAANKQGLGPEQTRLLVQGWNIDASLEHLKSASSLEDRLGNITIAHYDNVVKLLNTKQASADDLPVVSESDEVWDGYYKPPAEPFVQPIVKDAFAEKYPSEQTVDVDKVARAVENKTAKNAILRRDLVKKAREEHDVLERKFLDKIDEIDWAMAASHADPTIVKENLKVASKDAYAFLNQIEPRLKRKYDVNPSYIVYDPTKYPYKTILEGVKLARELTRAKNLTEKLAAICEQIPDPVIDYDAEIRKDPTSAGPGGFYTVYNPKQPVKPLFSPDEVEKISAGTFEVEKEAGVIGSKLRDKIRSEVDKLIGGAGDGLRGLPQEELARAGDRKKEKIKMQLSDPETTYNTRQIMDFTAITSLMSQDPELLNYDPAEVYTTYKELSNLAPVAMLNPVVARTMVRQALAQNGLGSYDLKLLVSIDALLREDGKNKAQPQVIEL